MKTALCVTAASIILASLTGCYGKYTPELEGLGHTPQEFRNMRKVSMNQNVRELNDEITRALMLDNPSRLSPWPVVDTSGMPR
ncbi:MAG TPA: hypothetical protein VMS30_03340 [Phycisphaerales bacterium]|nr:hypothetical protein [Phycisphaerales bacterium]